MSDLLWLGIERPNRDHAYRKLALECGFEPHEQPDESDDFDFELYEFAECVYQLAISDALTHLSPTFNQHRQLLERAHHVLQLAPEFHAEKRSRLISDIARAL